MMEGHATGNNVKVEEFRRREFGGVWVGWFEEGPIVGFHEFGGEAEGSGGYVVLVGAHGVGDVYADELAGGGNIWSK